MRPDPPSYRLATPDDRDGLTALLIAQLREHDVATPDAAIAAAVEGLLHRPSWGTLLVAARAGTLVGVAQLSYLWTLERGGRTTWLDELYVAPAARGHGVGTGLLEAALALAAAAGAAAVDLEVDGGHARVVALYERRGFQAITRRRFTLALPPAGARAARQPARVTGGCFCGALRWRVDTPPHTVTHCHCSICRRCSGAPFVTWATVPAAAFAWTAGAPVELRSMPDAVRTLCGTCGTALAFRKRARPDWTDVTAGSFDEPARLTPTDHIWTANALPWAAPDDALPRHPAAGPPEGRPGPDLT